MCRQVVVKPWKVLDCLSTSRRPLPNCGVTVLNLPVSNMRILLITAVPPVGYRASFGTHPSHNLQFLVVFVGCCHHTAQVWLPGHRNPKHGRGTRLQCRSTVLYQPSSNEGSPRASCRSFKLRHCEGREQILGPILHEPPLRAVRTYDKPSSLRTADLQAARPSM